MEGGPDILVPPRKTFRSEMHTYFCILFHAHNNWSPVSNLPKISYPSEKLQNLQTPLIDDEKSIREASSVIVYPPWAEIS